MLEDDDNEEKQSIYTDSDSEEDNSTKDFKKDNYDDKPLTKPMDIAVRYEIYLPIMPTIKEFNRTIYEKTFDEYSRIYVKISTKMREFTELKKDITTDLKEAQSKISDTSTTREMYEFEIIFDKLQKEYMDTSQNIKELQILRTHTQSLLRELSQLYSEYPASSNYHDN